MRLFLGWIVLAFILGIGPLVFTEVNAQPIRHDPAASQDTKKDEGAGQQQKETYEKELGAKLKELDRKWTELKRKAEGLKKEARDEMKPLLDDLKKKREEVAGRMKELKTSGEKNGGT